MLQGDWLGFTVNGQTPLFNNMIKQIYQFIYYRNDFTGYIGCEEFLYAIFVFVCVFCGCGNVAGVHSSWIHKVSI